MLLADPQQLRAAVPPGRRLMGLDVGTKTIGLALSDTRLIIASPLETIRRRRFREDIARAVRLDRQARGRRAGYRAAAEPRGRRQPAHPVGAPVRAQPLGALRDMPVALWDERLSTAAVTREMIAARHDPQAPRRDRRPRRRRLYPAGLSRRDGSPRANYLISASASRKRGCSALPSHSKTAISVVMISAPCRSSRRIAASLLSACREPTASRTR